MRRFSLYLLIPALLVCCLTACDSETSPDCFQSAGDYITIERTYNGNHDRLFIEDRIEVVLVEDVEQKIVITGPKNLLPEVITEVVGNDLFVRNDNTCNWVRDFDHEIIVAIHGIPPVIFYSGVSPLRSLNTLKMPYLEINSEDGAGDVRIDVEADSIRINNTVGTAAFNINGSVGEAHLFNQGINTLDASDLLSQSTWINNSGPGNVTATVDNYLFCIIENSGDVLVTGTPNTVDLFENGPGTFTLVEE